MNPLVIKLFNFFFYGAINCIIPFQGVIAIRYGLASRRAFGNLQMCLNIFDAIIGPTICAFADGFSAHRRVLSSCLLISCMGIGSLVGITYLGSQNFQISSLGEEIPEELSIQPAVICSSDDNELNQSVYNITDEVSLSDNLPSPDQYLWYIICICLSLGSNSISVIETLGDAITMNTAKMEKISYGSLRLWGALGSTFCSILQTMINGITFLPFLAPALILGVILSVANFINVAFWPSSKPFDLSRELTEDDDEHEQHLDAWDGIKFKFTGRLGWPRRWKTIARYEEEELQSISTVSSNIIIDAGDARIYMKPFDCDDIVKSRYVYRKIILSPHNLLLKSESIATTANLNWTTNQRLLTPQVTKCSLDSQNDQKKYLESSHENKSAKELAFQSNNQDNQDQDLEGFTFTIKIVMLIIGAHPSLLKFLFLFTCNGLLTALNLHFFFVYLEDILGEDRFAVLSGFIMISQSLLGEALFFIISPKIIRYLGLSSSLSLSMFVFGLRYLLYDAFIWFPTWLDVRYILLVEILQGINLALFYCVLTEVGLEYSLYASECIPELLRLGHLISVNNLDRSTRKIKNSVRATMPSICSAFFNGVGISVGSFLGGCISEAYDFETLWLWAAIFATTIGVANAIIDVLIDYSNVEQKRSTELH